VTLEWPGRGALSLAASLLRLRAIGDVSMRLTRVKARLMLAVVVVVLAQGSWYLLVELTWSR